MMGMAIGSGASHCVLICRNYSQEHGSIEIMDPYGDCQFQSLGGDSSKQILGYFALQMYKGAENRNLFPGAERTNDKKIYTRAKS